jgi:hypothetical protein
VEVPQRSGPRGALTNNGGPLLDTSQTSSAGAAGGFHTAPCSPQEHEEVRVRAPRHDFPKFRGETPLLWIYQCLTYFDMFKISSYQWVSMVSIWRATQRCGIRLTSVATLNRGERNLWLQYWKSLARMNMTVK